ncbi:MAG: SOS response-associated peptidase [Streptomycetales bacterium]
MCGRYAASRHQDALAVEFEIDRVETAGTAGETAASTTGETAASLAADYNVAPTKPVPAVLERLDPDSGRPERQLRLLSWGLVPWWARDPSGGGRLINARVETAAGKPAFRRAFAKRRCLLPADGYFEWHGGQPGRKQPFFIRPRGGGGLAMAGLYEIWRDPGGTPGDPRAWWWSATVLTTVAAEGLGHLHDRMPVLLSPDRFGAWLDPRRVDPAEVSELLVPAPAGALEAYPVSTAVNDVRNNGPHLITRVCPEPADATLF